MVTRQASMVVVAVVALAATATHPGASDVPVVEWPARLATVDSPARGPAAQPQLSTSRRGVVLSWIERQGTRATLKFAERTTAGWSAARAVASGDDWFVNWADVPSVIRLENGTLAAHWLQRSGAEKYAYDVRLSHSRDDGRTWAPSIRPHDDGTRTEHGFASLFQVPGRGLGVAWLDGRATNPAAHHGNGHAAGAMTVRAAEYDDTFRRTADTAVDLRACDCCPTSVAVANDGPILAYRDRSDDEVRDIVVTRLDNGRWTTPARVHADDWKIAACPVNGPMLDARGRDVVIAWFTAVGDVGHAYVAFSSDAGRSFGAPVRLDDEAALGRVDVALLADGSALATWIDLHGSTSSFSARRVGPQGRRFDAVVVAPLEGARTSGYPRLAVHGPDAVFAWTDTTGGTPTIRTATARLRR